MKINSGCLYPRAPVVTVMGHVDHGKTTLLDTIRNTNVCATEVGQITQRIGASVVNVNEKSIVFIDTPGHEVFTAMRVRGANVTDLVLLVVAADDGVMPQTVEAINHAKAANVPIIVAINKCDLPQSNPTVVKRQLCEYDLSPEEWGGKTIVVEVSAKLKWGIDELLEYILLEAEMLQLYTDISKPASGTVLESRLDKAKGPLITVILKEGTLHVGDPIVVGVHWGKVRALIDDKNRYLDSVISPIPVEVLGLSDLPAAGDKLIAVESITKARQLSLEKKEKSKKIQPPRYFHLTDLFARPSNNKIVNVKIIAKADQYGRAEVLKNVLSGLKVDSVKVETIHWGVGKITESDILLAQAANAMILNFGNPQDIHIENLAKERGIEIRHYEIIYELIDDIKAALAGMLKPKYEKRLIGKLTIKKIFNIPKVGLIAGCYVDEGKVKRGEFCRVLRNDTTVFEGKITSLRRFQENVVEVNEGYECGVGIAGVKDISEGDIVEVYSEVMV